MSSYAFEFVATGTLYVMYVLWTCVPPLVCFNLTLASVLHSRQKGKRESARKKRRTVNGEEKPKDNVDGEERDDNGSEDEDNGKKELGESDDDGSDESEETVEEADASYRARASQAVDIANTFSVLLFGTFMLPRVMIHRITKHPNLGNEFDYLLSIFVIHAWSMYASGCIQLPAKKSESNPLSVPDTSEKGSLSIMERSLILGGFFTLLATRSHSDSLYQRMFLSMAGADYFRCLQFIDTYWSLLKRLDASRWAMRISFMYPIFAEPFTWTRFPAMVLWIGCVMIPSTPLHLPFRPTSSFLEKSNMPDDRTPTIDTQHLGRLLLLPHIAMNEDSNSRDPSANENRLALVSVSRKRIRDMNVD